MVTALPERISEYRRQTFRIPHALRLKDREEAVAYVNERGFVFFWPITGIIYPSLWTAVAGDRPVADAHDDPGHITWDWKDSLLGQHRWYYAKILRKKSTMVSLELAPYFYALSENYGAPEEDYLTLYEQGRLTLEAKVVYEALLDEGPLDTPALRRATHMTSSESEHRFNRALTDLQADFKVLPVGVTQAGAWHYAFAYDIVPRHFPDLISQAQEIKENTARQQLCQCYFQTMGCTQEHELVKLFGWRMVETQRVLDTLVREGVIVRGLEIPGRPGEWFALRTLA